MATYTADFAGQIGVKPRRAALSAPDSTLAEIAVAGYMNKVGVLVEQSDFVFAKCSDGFGIFTASIDDSVVTLVPMVNTDELLLNGLEILGVDNTSGFIATLTNAVFGQSTTVTIPDPGAATAKLLVSGAALVTDRLVKTSGTTGKIVDAGYKILSATTATYGGGGTSNAFAATGLTASSIVAAVIVTSTNSVSVAKAVPGTNLLTVTFSADPGAGTTVSWIATTAAAT